MRQKNIVNFNMFQKLQNLFSKKKFSQKNYKTSQNFSKFKKKFHKNFQNFSKYQNIQTKNMYVFTLPPNL